MNITIDTLRASLDSNIASRCDYESSKNAHSASEKVARYYAFDFKTKRCDVSDAALNAALACNVASFDFINSHKRENQRFNVYAIEKTRKMLRALASNSAAMLDKYSRALLATLLHNRERSDFYLSRKDAYALMCRDIETQIKRSDMKSDVRVAANTATTQVSSSLRALEALNVLRFDEETKRVSAINFDHALFALFAKK